MKVLRSQEGRKVQVLDDAVCIKLKSIDSPHSMTVVTVEVAPGGFVPPHTHEHEEESYYMLDGSMLMQLEEEKFVITPHDFVHIPAGTLHSYQNTSDQTIRFLAWMVGGRTDEFFTEMAEKIREIPTDLPKMPEILNRYGVHMMAQPN